MQLFTSIERVEPIIFIHSMQLNLMGPKAIILTSLNTTQHELHSQKPLLYNQDSNINYVQIIIVVRINLKEHTISEPQMDQQKQYHSYNGGMSNSSGSRDGARNLFALIGQDSMEMKPYRSKFQMMSIDSEKSRISRDSDLMNKLCQDQSKSSKSLSRNVSNSNIKNKSFLNSSNQNSIVSEGSRKGQAKITIIKQPPKIHNCVCFAAGQCLSYNCNCFLSPFPCAPQCCPNCLNLKSNLPHKISNMCNCKKTHCLKLYCECLANGQFCSVMCRCQLCQNHEHSTSRQQSISRMQCQPIFKGCSCQKSRCVKKYCECYSKGLKCTDRCICFGCKNMIENQNEGRQPEYRMQEQRRQPKREENQMKDENELEFEEIDFYSGRIIR